MFARQLAGIIELLVQQLRPLQIEALTTYLPPLSLALTNHYKPNRSG